MSGRLSAILDNLERVSQDPACPLEEREGSITYFRFLIFIPATRCHLFINI